MSDRFAHLDFEVPALPKPKPQPTPASMELDRLKRYQDMLAAMGIPDSYEPREVLALYCVGCGKAQARETE